MHRRQLRKKLSAPGLLKTIRGAFEKVPEHRSAPYRFSLPDTLMSGLAIFSLKYPSLLKFDEQRNDPAVQANLKSLYGVKQAPCDTQMRTILDPINPVYLRGVYREVHRILQRHKVLEAYRYLGDYYWVSIDGTGQFHSEKIRCEDCCIKKTAEGEAAYFHQLLSAVLIHPDLSTVLPFAPEAILGHDGENKNDCERNAAKRLLAHLRREHPHLKMIVVEDSLAGNGPHLNLLNELDFRYLIMVKEGDHEALFETVQEKLRAGECDEFEEVDEAEVVHGFRFVNGVPLNKTHPDILVNFLEYWEIEGDSELLFTWITDLYLSRDTVYPIMRGGRARWKIENETFNTLKNHGYHLEHNYGHGKQHLATVFAFLMMLAFLVDQVQELCCGLFNAARQRYRSRTSLWEKMRSLFTSFLIDGWQTLWCAIIHGHRLYDLQPDTS
jgi:hypothetical protein